MDGFQQTHVPGANPTTSYQDFAPQYPVSGPNQHPAPPGVTAQEFQGYYEGQIQDVGQDNAAVNPQLASYPSQPPPPPPGEPPPGVGEAVEYVQGINQQAYSEAAAGAVYWNGQEQAQWAAEYYKPGAQQAQYYQDMGQSYQDYYQYQYDGQYMGPESSQMGQFNPSQVQPPQQYYTHQVPGMDQGDDANMSNPASAHIDSTTDSHPAMAQIPVDLSQVIIPQAMAQQYIVPHQLQSGTKCLGMAPPLVMSKPKSTVPEWLKQEMMKRGIKNQPGNDAVPPSVKDGKSEEGKQLRRFSETKSSDVNVKNERKKDASIPSNSNIAAKQPSKHEDVNINKVVKAIALPLLLSVTDALFDEIANEALAHPGEELAPILAMEIITEVTDEFCAEMAVEVHQEASSAKVALSLESGPPGGKHEADSTAEEATGLNLLGLGYASDSSLSNGESLKVKGAMDRALMGPANHEGVASVANDQDATQQEDSESPQVNPDNVDLPSNISCTIPKVPDEPDEARCQLSEDVSKELASEDVRRKKKGENRIGGKEAVSALIVPEKTARTIFKSKQKVGGDCERLKGGEDGRAPNKGTGDQGHGESSQRHRGMGDGEARARDSRNLAGTRRTSSSRERSKRSRESSPSRSRKHGSGKGSDGKSPLEHHRTRVRSGGKRRFPQQSEGSRRKSTKKWGRDLSSGDDEAYRHSKQKLQRQDSRHRRARSADRHRSSR